MKLEVEPIPERNWGKSLANLLPPPVWDTLRREVYRKFNYQCCICGAVDVELHCHEKWSYKGNAQTLVGFQCLCKDCHAIKHWGRTIKAYHDGEYSRDYIEYLRKHFCEVNSCTEEDMTNHIVEKGEENLRRSRKKYRIDFGLFAPEKVVRVWRKQ